MIYNLPKDRAFAARRPPLRRLVRIAFCRAGVGKSRAFELRKAMSLTELLVAMAIIGILICLLLLGVQAAREAARNAECKANLRQIGLAIEQYQSVHRMYPPGLSHFGSLHVAILPFLEQSSLYETIAAESNNAVRGPNWHSEVAVAVGTYLCPSDGTPATAWPRPRGGAGTNYAGNCGTWAVLHGFDGIFRFLDVPISYGYGPVRAADVTDGTSNTACVAEILRTNRSMERLRVNWNTTVLFSKSNEINDFASLCQSVPFDAASAGWRGNCYARGNPWTNGNVGYTLYNHVLSPQQPSCYNKTEIITAASTAASAHPGGVNLLFADGHLEFIVSSIDMGVWREFASRASQRYK